MLFKEQEKESIENLLKRDPTGKRLYQYAVIKFMDPKVPYPIPDDMKGDLNALFNALINLPDASKGMRTRTQLLDFLSSIEGGRLYDNRYSFEFSYKLNEFIQMRDWQARYSIVQPQEAPAPEAPAQAAPSLLTYYYNNPTSLPGDVAGAVYRNLSPF